MYFLSLLSQQSCRYLQAFSSYCSYTQSIILTQRFLDNIKFLELSSINGFTF